MPLTVIEPRRLYRQVAQQIRAAIDRGDFPAGSRLPTERELAANLGVSRPTIREAMIALEVDARVKIRVGSGIYVLPTPVARLDVQSAVPAGPFEILQARSLIEGAVAEAAATKVTPQGIATLDEILSLMKSTAHPGPESIAVDRMFHVAVADMLGNDATTQIVGSLFDQRFNPYFEGLARYFETPDSWQAARDEHLTIRNALAAADSVAAAVAMRAHLAASQARFSNSFGPAPAAPTNPLDITRKGVRPRSDARTASSTARK